jgi:hypothetical protein
MNKFASRIAVVLGAVAVSVGLAVASPASTQVVNADSSWGR